jgi:hypothetical protein
VNRPKASHQTTGGKSSMSNSKPRRSFRGKLRAAAAVLIAAAALSLAGAATASAAPLWKLTMHHNPTNFPPSGTGQIWLVAHNVGNTNATGPITMSLTLPPGLTRKSVSTQGFFPEWECPGAPGDTTLTCTWNDEVNRKAFINILVVSVDAAPSASGSATATASITGGGAPVTASSSDSETLQISSAAPGFGLVDGSFEADFFEEDDTTPVRQAGAHPYALSVAFDLNSVPADYGPEFSNVEQTTGDETFRNVEVDLPLGFVGNPNVVAECTPVQLNAGECPRSSQVGRLDITTTPLQPFEGNYMQRWNSPVFNMESPKGVITDLAISVAGNPAHIRASLDPTDYSIRTTVAHINESLPVFDQRITIWGTPADPSHDWERCVGLAIGPIIEPFPAAPCPTDQPRKPFLTVPSQCGVAHQTEIRNVDSWQNTGTFVPPEFFPEPGFVPTGCENQRFDPDVQIHPVSEAANSPTGLDVNIRVPQVDNPNSLDTALVKKTVVSFPEGMTVSPSFADGLTACSLDQIGLNTNSPVRCPGSSRIGTVDVRTPVLPKPLTGSMFLAEQTKNPFGSLLATYIVLEDTEERGILIKIPGRIDLDEQTGRIVATFDELPQFPFSEFELHFRSGPRAPLINPPTCGTHTIGIDVISYGAHHKDSSDTYQVSQGPEGSGCVNDPAKRPFEPKISGGTANPNAGSYSPFVFRMTRTDREQELSQIEATLPPGLIAKIKGIPYCPEAAIGAVSGALGTGTSELNNPSCPAASQIGTVNAGAGSGPGPNYFPGKIYLAGPYKGAPLSIVVVFAALAGPFDLGNLAVRTALRLDADTAQVTATSDPFPLIFHGVLLRVRDVRLNIDRPETILNPTNCAEMAILGKMTGTGGDVFSTADDTAANLRDRFQVANCAALGFRPRISFNLKGGTKRGGHPSLRAELRARPGDANIAATTVTLPRSAFLEQAHIRTVCTRVQFAAKQCPPASAYGYAKAFTPLLDQPLEGPVYLRSSNNKLPDLVAALGGQIDIEIAARIDSVKGRIRSTFPRVPDAPVSRFVLTMQGAKKGLIVNSRNLCSAPSRASIQMTGQNGKPNDFKPLVKAPCGGKGRKGGKRK